MKKLSLCVLVLLFGLSGQALLSQSYVFSFDPPPVGPNSGDAGQPRSDANVNYGDVGGNELMDGTVPSVYTGIGYVAFNELTVDNLDPQPRIEYDLGGTFNLTSMSVNYLGGGAFGIRGPQRLDLYLSTDNGATYPASPDVTYSGFDRTTNDTFPVVFNDTIVVLKNGVTNVKAEFFQDNTVAASTGWVFLGETQFQTSLNPVPTLSEWALVFLFLVILCIGGIVIFQRRGSMPGKEQQMRKV